MEAKRQLVRRVRSAIADACNLPREEVLLPSGKKEVRGGCWDSSARNSVGEKPFTAALGGGYRFTATVAVEAEVTFCPQNPSCNFGETLFAAGPRAGVGLGRAVVSGRLRAGVVRFAGRQFRSQNGHARTEPAIDIGGVLQRPVSSWVAVRMDIGDLIVPFGSEPIRSGLPPYATRLGVTHNLIGSIGLLVRV
jgi:hypothetical protein